MGLIGRLFGNPGDIAKAGETLMKGFDDLIYTKQEKAQDLIRQEQKDVSEGRQVLISWMETSKGQNLSRRLLAILFVCTYVLMFIIMTLFAILSIWHGEKLQLASEILGGAIDDLDSTVMLIVGFYFAAPHLKNFLPNRNKKTEQG